VANCSSNIHFCVSVPCQLVGSRPKAEVVRVGDRLPADVPEHYKVMVVVHRFGRSAALPDEDFMRKPDSHRCIWLPNAKVQLQASYHHCGIAASKIACQLQRNVR
jgi:hypothetical protein